MLFLLVLLVFMFGWFLLLFGCYGKSKIGYSEFLHWVYYKGQYIAPIIIWISGAIISIMCTIMIFQYTGTNARIERDKETYLALNYKIETEYRKNNYNQQTKETIDEIQEWNEYVAYHKNIQNDFWVGIFYPDIYDELKRIPLKGNTFTWN